MRTLTEIPQKPRIRDTVKVRKFFSDEVQHFITGRVELNYATLKIALEETMTNCEGKFGELKTKRIDHKFLDIRASQELLKILKTKITARNLPHVYRSVLTMYNRSGSKSQFGDPVKTICMTGALATIMTSCTEGPP
jgi:hypothetical protein